MIFLSVSIAAFGGLVAPRLRLPGGSIMGALIASVAWNVLVAQVLVPTEVRYAILMGLGATVGMLVTRELLTQLRASLIPAVLSAALIIVAGALIALLLDLFGYTFPGLILATSPGGLSVLSAAALEHGLDAPNVALFHTVRVLVVIVSIPLLVRLLPPTESDGTVAAAQRAEPLSRDLPSPAPTPRRFIVPLTLLGAVAGGSMAVVLGFGGGIILGSTVMAATVHVSFRSSRSAPRWLTTSAQIGIGWMIGTLVTADTMSELSASIGPALLAAGLLVGSGVVTALLLRRTGWQLPGDVFATSPGAFEALTSVAIAQDRGAAQVAMFHTFRLLMVIASLPMLLRLV